MSQQTNWVPTSVDLEKASAARMYDYLLGGNHNFAVDRALVEDLLRVQPEIKRYAIMNRAFMRRAVLFMVEQGIRQFLDLGSGIPTVGNVHEIARTAVPDAKVVYVDNEHVAVAHSQLLLEGEQDTVMIHADITKPNLVLGDEATRRVLDFDRPIGLLAITIGHYIIDAKEANDVFSAYRDALAPGSHLALTHFTEDFSDVKGDEIMARMRASQNNILHRPKAEILPFFGDFELVEPGLVSTSRWRPEREPDEGNDGLYAGVARKR